MNESCSSQASPHPFSLISEATIGCTIQSVVDSVFFRPGRVGLTGVRVVCVFSHITHSIRLWTARLCLPEGTPFCSHTCFAPKSETAEDVARVAALHTRLEATPCAIFAAALSAVLSGSRILSGTQRFVRAGQWNREDIGENRTKNNEAMADDVARR